MKLQDAFVAEKGTRVGNWKEIGYLMQNTSNFFYCDLAADCAGGFAAQDLGLPESMRGECRTNELVHLYG